MINSEQIQALRAAAEKATTLDLDSAQIERGNDGYYECPVCCGAGEVEAKTDFCNIDGVALGVQFYGIGEHHGAAEAYFRAAKPAAILSLLAERDADKALIAELQEKQRETLRQARSFREAHDSASEIIRRHESRTIHLELPTTRLWAGTVDCYETKEILMAIRAACAAAGITLVVGE